MSVQVELESLSSSAKVKMKVYTIPQVTGNTRVIDWRPLAKKWKHIPFSNIGLRSVVNILIGIGYVELHCALEESKGDPGDSVA